MIQGENGYIKRVSLEHHLCFFFYIFREKVKCELLAFLEELNNKF